MGCCGNKAGCKNNVEAQSLPTQDFLGAFTSASAGFITALQEIATAGLNAGTLFRALNIKNAALEQLAKQVTDLAVENAYFKSVLNLFTPMDIHVSDSTFEFNFGPKNAYSLKLAVTSKNSRREIAKQLRAAADKLEAELSADPSPNQQFFPFVETT